jgi:hypothetical protein
MRNRHELAAIRQSHSKLETSKVQPAHPMLLSEPYRAEFEQFH